MKSTRFVWLLSKDCIVCVYYTWNKHHFYQLNKLHGVYNCMCYAFCGWFNDCIWTIMLNCCHNPVIVARKWAAVHWLHRRAERQDERFLQKQVFLTFWRGEVWSCHTVWGSYSFFICFLCINVSKILKGLKQQILEKFLKFAKFDIQRGLYLYMNVQGQNVSIRQKLFVSNSVPVISISTQTSGLRN